MMNTRAREKAITPALLLLALLIAAPLAAQEISLDAEPRRYLVIHVDGARDDWEVLPIKMTDRNGLDLQGARSGDLGYAREFWNTGKTKRYDVSLWKQAAATHLGENARAGARFHFYAMEPHQPRAEGKLNLVDQQRHTYWVPAESVEVKGYPQSWVDIFEGYVDQFTGAERQEAVKRWEKTHREIIRNDDNNEDWFTQEERNEFARFYQRQFVYIRDNNPKLASIYDELASFHRERENLDAELSTYLAALRAGVESPDRERFALAVGRIFVNRLNLYREAVPYLQQARNHTEALYLLARCHVEEGDYPRAREELNGLVATLGSPDDDEIVLESDAEEEIGRARLTLAEVDFKLKNFAALEETIAAIPPENSHWDAARVLYCAMLIQRDRPRTRDHRSDADLARELIAEVSFWDDAVAHTNPGEDHAYPLDPLMARALVVYAQGHSQFRERKNDRSPPQPDEEVMRFLNAAKALDPLSAEPHYAEGRLMVHLGRFSQAYAAFQGGLDVNPTHVPLNFAVADLNLKTGRVSLAKEHLENCLKHDADFFPAHVMLGEIAIHEFERMHKQLLNRRSAGEAVDYAGELVPLMKEAAAFFSSALEINPGQPATELALATLYLRLSEVAPLTITDRGESDAVRRAYLVKARDMAWKLIEEIEEFAESEQSGRDLTRVPSLAAFNVYAFALHTLNEHGEALEWFRRHIEKAYSRRYIPDNEARKEYEESAALAYAQDWVRRIERNRRQYFEIDDFNVDSKEDFWGNWIIPQKLKPDLDFREEVLITGGKLVFDVKQKETDVVSRFETRKPHQTLAMFEAEFPEVGDIYLDRGIHLTKAQASTAAEPSAKYGVMLGISGDGDVYWETREYDVEDPANTETVAGRGIIDPARYGGIPLRPEDRLIMSLRRQLSEDKSAVEYVATINGYEVTLPVELKGLTRNDLNTDSWVVMTGFFASGLGGAEGRFEVERARFVYDGGLGNER